MQKFILGLLLGLALAVAYVRLGLSLPGVVELPGRLQGNIIATAIDEELYAMGGDAARRRRALEVFFDHQAALAAEVDADAGHPFLEALHRRRASREARQLLQQWSAFDEALSKPALRAVLERRHSTSETLALKRAMLSEALEKMPFLKAWLARRVPAVARETLLDTLREVGADAASRGDKARGGR